MKANDVNTGNFWMSAAYRLEHGPVAVLRGEDVEGLGERRP